MIRTIQLPPPGVPLRLKRRERTPAAEGGTMGEKFPRILPKVATSTSLLGRFTCRKFTTWDRRLYFPSEGRRADDFFARFSCPYIKLLNNTFLILLSSFVTFSIHHILYTLNRLLTETVLIFPLCLQR